MEIALSLVAIAIAVVAVSALAGRLGVSPPLLLLVAGIGLSLIPFVPSYQLSPELVLVGILPPLLYSAAYNTSFIDFRANRRALISLSVGLVIFTTLFVGVVAWWLIPGLPLAAGFAIGAIVAPPDAIAASAVARRVGMPTAIVSVLEGESLVNDATALTALRAAILALAGTVTVLEISWDFAVAAVGGVIIGAIVAAIWAPVRKRISNPSYDTVLAFTIPFIAYIPAEEIGSSGVIAVVVAGLIIGHKSPLLQSGTARLQTEGNWRSVSFFLEHTVFFLIGLQLKDIVETVVNDGFDMALVAWACLGVYLATVVARFVWVYGDSLLQRIPFGAPRAVPPWRAVTVISWAGMRGVVTLAAALALPIDIPWRDVLILVALVVVVASILIQGSTLPWLVRRLRLRPPDPGQEALAEAALLDRARTAGRAELEVAAARGENPEVIARLRTRTNERSNAAWERVGGSRLDSEAPIATYQRLRLDMLDAERVAVIGARDDGTASDQTVRAVIRILDVEEAMLDHYVPEPDESMGELVTPSQVSPACSDIETSLEGTQLTPPSPPVCERCLLEGTTAVRLRMCLTCGAVGCCDSSAATHADRHFRETGHPVMRSVEPREAWRWCYVHSVLG